MKPVFADTSFFLALIDSRDQYHRSAAELNASLDASLVTTQWVLLEFANGIAASRARAQFGLVLARLNSEPDVKIIDDPGSFNGGCRLYVSRKDKEWSLTDCISFHVTREHGLVEALTADHHFEQAGFHPLMRG